MENQENPPPENNQPPAPAPGPLPAEIQIHVACNLKTGQLAVHFPFEHKALSIKILAQAICAVLDAQPPSAIIPAQQLPPGIKMLFKRNGNH